MKAKVTTINITSAESSGRTQRMGTINYGIKGREKQTRVGVKKIKFQIKFARVKKYEDE